MICYDYECDNGIDLHACCETCKWFAHNDCWKDIEPDDDSVKPENCTEEL